jgi:von Willebrand factor type D domain
MNKVGIRLVRLRFASQFSALVAVALSSTAWLAPVEQVQAQVNTSQAPLHATPTQNAPIQARPVPNAAELETWRRTILKVPTPNSGCFTANYPDSAWTAMPCKTPPHTLFRPKPQGVVRPSKEVGGASYQDFAPYVYGSGQITEAEGSFDSVSNLTSECEIQCPNANCSSTPVCTASDPANSFSLQLNTGFLLNTKACDNPTCYGWEQFVYAQTGTCSTCSGSAFIQYWLIDYSTTGTCPAPAATAAECNGGVLSDKWCYYSPSCVINSPFSPSPPPVPITSLSQLKLTGDAPSGSVTTDSVTFWENGVPYRTTGANYFPDLNTMWYESEFNVFGDGNDSQAVFNNGTTLKVRSAVNIGKSGAPGCNVFSGTGESNNTNLGTNRPTAVEANLPAVVFTESTSYPTDLHPSCAAARSIGDTHITTFDGLYYDFQASGDFVLLESQNFTVQTRQAPGPAHYPGTSVTKAVATQMGTSRVEIYLSPRKLLINGKAVSLASGKSVLLSTGVQVTLQGNQYDVTSESGDSVHATLDTDPVNPWIDVTVGLGKTPSPNLLGLLGNPAGNGQQLETPSGAVLKEPVSFSDLYNAYGDSWRVPEGKSLFTVASTIKPANPTKPLSASDLDPTAAAHALAACKAAGITDQDLLDSCTLDTTVLNADSAVQAFTAARVPVYVIHPAASAAPKAPQ